MTDQNVNYSKIFLSDYSVTGIRSENENNSQVLMTGSCPITNTLNTIAMLYRGPMNPTNSSGCNCIDLTPKVGKPVFSSMFYGPDTHLSNPNKIDEGNVRAVGTYKYQGDPLGNVDHGVLYNNGPLDGSGDNWIKIDMDGDEAHGTVLNTLPHSTMGDLIVGNYDLQGDTPGKFNAFIYHTPTGKYRKLRLEPYPFVTAYGIWQNFKNQPKYTIAGGLDDGSGINVGYMVDYDSDTLSDPTKFEYKEDKNFITHFEGITDFGKEMTDFGPRYYSLAATGDQTPQNLKNGGAAFVVVERLLPDGLFGDPHWQPFQVGSSLTTGNTVLTNNLFGIYSLGNQQFQSYLAPNFPL